MSCRRFLLGSSGRRPAHAGAGGRRGQTRVPGLEVSAPRPRAAAAGDRVPALTKAQRRRTQARPTPLPMARRSPPAPGTPPAAVPGEDSPERDAVGAAWPAAGSSPGEPNPAAICPLSLAVPSSLLACSALMGCDVIPAVVPPLQPGMDACCAGERADPLSRHISRAPLKTGT